MFKVGAFYETRVWEDTYDGKGGTASYGPRKVVDFNFPLITLEDHDGAQTIVNTASLVFISAAIVENYDPAKTGSKFFKVEVESRDPLPGTGLPEIG